MMNAFALRKYSKNEALQLVDLPVPVLKHNQVMVKV